MPNLVYNAAKIYGPEAEIKVFEAGIQESLDTVKGYEAKVTEVENNYIRVDFDTRWKPPLVWLREIAAKYPELSFSLVFDEPSRLFQGAAFAYQGQLIGRDWIYNNHRKNFGYDDGVVLLNNL